MIDYKYKVRLDRIKKSDLTFLRDARNDSSIRHWCRQHDLISDLDQERWYERQNQDPTISMYSILDLDGHLCGVCGLTSIDHIIRRAEFSLYIFPKCQKKGYGEVALKTLFNHGFLELNLNQIYGETFKGNPALSLFEKLGMSKDGLRRDFYYKDGKYVDSILISLMRTEWNI